MRSQTNNRIIGTYRRNPRGFGFLTPEGTDGSVDLYVSALDAEGLISGDSVSARMAKRGKRDGKMRYQARDLVLLKRGRTRFVGELQHRSRHWMIVPNGRGLGALILVADPASTGAQAGDQVVVELSADSADDPRPFGTILRVLGKCCDPGVDTASIIEQYELPTSFDEDAQAEATAAAASYVPGTVALQREDLRKLTVVTIDPPRAKDFDDAISLSKKPDGTTELGVHIADVAHFVPEGGALDAVARERSTSVYLADSVIPMLPEALSNGVCSLQERQDRLTKSVFITYGPRGAVKRTRFANTIIRSTRRLTYDEVSRLLDGSARGLSAKVVALIAEMARLAAVIRKRRLRKGMLVLDLPEVELVLDDQGKAVGVEPAGSSFAHTIIEMFMVEANEAVARYLTRNKVTFLRRVHEEPATPAWCSLSRFLGTLGHRLPSRPDRKALQDALEHFRHRREVRAVHLSVLRSMQKAHYAPSLIGHYALAGEDYCHFTSPIRRYPDLTVHRLIDAQIHAGQLPKPRLSARAKHKNPKMLATLQGRQSLGQCSNLQDPQKTGVHCSARERRAEAAEQELKLVLLLRLLADRPDQVHEGSVTGVAKSGLFVQLDEFLVEGRLPFDNLRQDRWRGDPTRGCAVGVRNGRRIAVGDRFRVRVSKIDLPARQLELTLAGSLPKSSRKVPIQSSGRSLRKSRDVKTRSRRRRNDRRT